MRPEVLNADRVRVEVVRIFGRGERQTTEFTITPRAQRVLELALAEASALGHSHIGTEHMLIALLREGAGGAATVIAELGISGDAT